MSMIKPKNPKISNISEWRPLVAHQGQRTRKAWTNLKMPRGSELNDCGPLGLENDLFCFVYTEFSSGTIGIYS